VGEPILQVHNLSKDFLLPHLRQTTIKGHVLSLFRERKTMQVQHALRDIDVSVERGEFFGVVGRNGSGKSTLLKILAGIYMPTRGNVTIGGRLVPFIELGVGFNPELTGRENVYLNGALLGFSKREVERMYDDIVAFAELEGSMDQKLKNYSSGMQVRIAFSVATRAKADILLIDEVLAVGDVAFQRKCYDHFRTLKRGDTTIVFVSHDMNTVREFCDRAILIENSRVVAQGKAGDVASEYLRLFLGEGPREGAGGEERWGEGDIRYEWIKASNHLVEGEPLEVELEALAHKDVIDPIFSIRVSDADGQQITGTNTLLKGRSIGAVRKGERIRLSWSMPNIFSNGAHHLDVAIHHLSDVPIYDMWVDAGVFVVTKAEKGPFIVTPDTSVRIDRQ
jgi:ABC-2 type transport system ATP-binding protein